MGSPETVFVPPKAKALCYNTVSLLPARLIRAPVLKPRPRSQAGKTAGCLVPIWQTSSSRAVRRGRMYAARKPAAATRPRCHRRDTLVCRGGIYASRQGCAPRGVCGIIGRIRRSVGRAFTPAEP